MRSIARIAGVWIVTLAVAGLSILVGSIKFTQARGWDRAFAHWGYAPWARPVVGVAEIAAGVLMLAPPAAAYGATLMAVVMTGAIGTHVVHHEYGRLVPPLILLTLSAIVLLIRRPPWLRVRAPRPRASPI
jgi:putative oxidoreductase